MRNNQISTIITLNIKDFKKFDFIQAVDPFAALRTSDPAPRPPASGHITYSRQSITEREVAAVCSVLRSDRLTQGPKVTEFEQALAARCEAKHAVAVANGTMALHLACMALNVQPGDTGLTSPISFLASANCLVSCGATPTFADIDPKTLCLSPERVEQYCKANTIPKVVIPVDFAGIPADLSRFKDLAEQYGFWLIEDAAHSLGSTYTNNGRSYPCGSCAHTHLAILSFHPVKSVTSGEGGAVLTNDDRLAMTLRKLVNHGVERTPTAWNVSEANLSSHDLSKPPPTWYHEMQILGYNARITDIHCALGLSQLSRLNRFKKRRQEIVTIYNQNLMSLAGSGKVVLPPWPAGSSPCQHLYPLRLGPEARITRDQLFEKMQKQDIYCQLHYMPIYRQPFYRKHFPHNPQQFPEAEHYFQNALSLPLFADLDNDSIERVLETIHAAV